MVTRLLSVNLFIVRLPINTKPLADRGACAPRREGVWVLAYARFHVTLMRDTDYLKGSRFADPC